MLTLLSLFSCGSGEPQPVDLYKEDMCALCRMAISEKVFAAQIVTHDGDALKFDDIGCLIEFLSKKPAKKMAASFVVDYTSKNWIKADQASFLISEKLKTPMGYGYAAFANTTEAQAARQQFPGAVKTLSELVK